jgi:hypothetical protein
MHHEAHSRRLNAALGGNPSEMLCARAHRLRLWPVIWALDLWFWLRWGDPYHCRRIAHRERMRRLDATDERFRRVME